MTNQQSNIKEEVCNTSLEILSQKIKKLLSTKFDLKDFWVPDYEIQCPTPKNKDGVIDVILLGGFLQRFLEVKNWPEYNFRFWTCSSSVKDVLVYLLHIDEECISVISRYDLFPPSKASSPIPTSNQKIDLVFAGRLSPSKNIECLILTAHHLQTQCSLNLQLHFFGNYDDLTSADRGIYRHKPYQNKIQQLLEKLTWNNDPILYGKLASSEWIQRKFDKPVLVNFSTFMSEDFDVSLAQAQEIGWPSIITDWGGHQDQHLGNSILIPWHMIGRSDEPDTVIKYKSEIIARYLAKILSTPISRPINSSNENIKIPKFLNKNRLQSALEVFVETHSTDVLKLESENLSDFAETSTGKAFFSKYRHIFGNAKSINDQNSICFINDLNERPDALNEFAQRKCKEIASKHDYKTPLIPIPIHQFTQTDHFSLIMNSNEIYFSFYIPEFLSILKKILPLAKNDCRIHIYLSKSSELITQSTLNKILELDTRIRVSHEG